MVLRSFLNFKQLIYLCLAVGVVYAVCEFLPRKDVNHLTQVERETLDVMGVELASVSPASGGRQRSLQFFVMESMGYVYEEYTSDVIDEQGFEHDVLPKDLIDGGIDQALSSGWDRYLLGGDDKRPAIAIVIDDLGLDRRRSARAIQVLPSDITFAYLPYAGDLQSQTQAAAKDGHELIIHFPMEPLGESDPGPNALRAGMSDADLSKVFENVFSQFDGYVGVNNHMGSKATQDRRVMDAVMTQMQRRGLFYFDSRTINGTVAGVAAKQGRVPYAVRDVFLDHEETEEFVWGALKKVEDKALRDGVAIAIGHPKDVTLDVLASWVKDIEQRGFRLVPLSEAVLYPNGEVAQSMKEAAAIVR